jgi:hypothetical protein
MAMRAARLAWLGLVGSCWLQACASEPHHDDVGLLTSAIRPLAGMTTQPPYFAASDRIEQLDSAGGHFRVHFTRAGQHAVPADDANGDDTPDFVARVAVDFDEVLEFYKQLGYREPLRDGDVPGDHGGDDRFDVYLLNFPNAGADGQFRADDGCGTPGCGGYMLLENDFGGKGYETLGEGIRLVSSHELFHAVQQAYAADIDGWLSEGTAVWASEAFDAKSGDLERQVRLYFERPEGSLAQAPPGIDPIRYAGAVFFQMIDEHAGRETLLRMWEVLAETGDSWPVALDAALQEHGSSLAEAFGTFVEWNLFTGTRADPERSYAHGDQFPEITEREIAPGYTDDAVRIFPMAARYYALRATSSDTLIARVELPEPAEALQLMLAVERDEKIGDVVRDSRELEVEITRGDLVHIAVYNTASSGGSVRPDICITTQSMGGTCGSTAVTDAGVSDAGAPDAPATSAANDDGGCAVAVVRGELRHGWLLSLAAVGAALGHRRRSRA